MSAEYVTLYPEATTSDAKSHEATTPEAEAKYKYSWNEKRNRLVERMTFTYRHLANENDNSGYTSHDYIGTDESSDFIIDQSIHFRGLM